MWAITGDNHEVTSLTLVDLSSHHRLTAIMRSLPMDNIVPPHTTKLS